MTIKESELKQRAEYEVSKVAVKLLIRGALIGGMIGLVIGFIIGINY